MKKTFCKVYDTCSLVLEVFAKWEFDNFKIKIVTLNVNLVQTVSLEIFKYKSKNEASFVMFVMLSYLFIAAMLSPAGKGLTTWLSFLLCFIVFCHFPMWCPETGVVLDCIVS